MRIFRIDAGFKIGQMRKEIDDMTDVLLGRVPPPVDAGPMTLMEVAEAYHARASEMAIRIHRAETEGDLTAADRVSKFRKTELRAFLEMSRKAVDLGSRRITGIQVDEAMRGGGTGLGIGHDYDPDDEDD